MTYEEKRELRLQISQLLSDAGLNQATIKEIVNKEIENKVDRAIDQGLKRLNATTSSGDYIADHVNNIFRSANMNYHISTMIKEELKNRMIQVTLKNVEINQEK